jgi:hypothetical protein
MYLASTRTSPDNPEIPALCPDWVLTLEQAIQSRTRVSAWAARLDHVSDMLEVGLAVDLVDMRV